MRVEPIADGGEVAAHVGPAVVGARLDHKLCLDARGFHLLDEALGLLERHEPVFVAVEDERGRVVGGDVGDRGDAATDLEDFRFVGDGLQFAEVGIELAAIEGAGEVPKDAAAEGVFAGLAVVAEIGRREKTGDGLTRLRRGRWDLSRRDCRGRRGSLRGERWRPRRRR